MPFMPAYYFEQDVFLSFMQYGNLLEMTGENTSILINVCCFVQPWLKKVADALPDDEREEFKTKAQPAVKFLLGMIKELQL